MPHLKIHDRKKSDGSWECIVRYKSGKKRKYQKALEACDLTKCCSYLKEVKREVDWLFQGPVRYTKKARREDVSISNIKFDKKQREEHKSEKDPLD